MADLAVGSLVQEFGKDTPEIWKLIFWTLILILNPSWKIEGLENQVLSAYCTSDLSIEEVMIWNQLLGDYFGYLNNLL